MGRQRKSEAQMRRSIRRHRAARPCSANGFEVAVQLWRQLIEQRLQRIHVGRFQQSSTVRAPQKKFRFVEGASGCPDKSPIVRETSSSFPFRDIGANTVGRPDKLHSNRVLRKRIPSRNQISDPVRHFLRESIHPQILEIVFHPPHNLSKPTPAINHQLTPERLTTDH